MIGIIKFVSLLATCLLFFDGLQEVNWSQVQLSTAFKPILDLILQGNDILTAFFEASPKFAEAAKNSVPIEGVASAAGVSSLVVLKKFSIFDYFLKFCLMLVLVSFAFSFLASTHFGDAPQSWCMQLSEMIQDRENNPIGDSQSFIPSMRQEMVENGCGRFGPIP